MQSTPRGEVWVTRAEPGAAATATRVRALGWTPLVAPLIAVRALPAEPPDLAGVAALAFTSAAGVRAYAALTAGGRGLPVFAVGAATAAAARTAGFAQVDDADGDGAALAARLAAAGPGGVVLAPGAEAPAFDLSAALTGAGVEVRPAPLYATEATAPPADALRALAQGELAAVLLQSPSAARAFDACATPSAAPPLVLSLSPTCRPADAAWPVRVAAAPRERDLLALLKAVDSALRPR